MLQKHQHRGEGWINMGLLEAPLEDLVFEFLRADSITTRYNKGFFDALTAYSFEKTHLDMDEHFRPYVHVTGMLDGFARNDKSFTRGIEFLNDPSRRLESMDNSPALLSFCNAVMFFSGILPEAFNKRIVSADYYRQLAKNGFYALHRRASKDSYFKQMGDYIDRYIGALSFMRNNLLVDSFSNEDDDLLNKSNN